MKFINEDKPMKFTYILILTTLLAIGSIAFINNNKEIPISKDVVQTAFGNHKGCFIMINCNSGKTFSFNPKECTIKHPPCSTFKIWNTLIGFENGAISSADEPFYKWDGVTRFMPEWNKDLTLKEAFTVSCVPAFQELARKIGSKNMKTWLDKIGYGDCNISSGIDIFWLPRKGKKSLLISPEQQVKLICQLISGKLPFSEKSCLMLEDMMSIKKTNLGSLYGKTGSGYIDKGDYDIGWFVGYLKNNGEKYAFACFIKGTGLSGKDAKAIVINIFEKQQLL